MEQEELKRKLSGLWEKTSHKSKELISVFLNYYFDENFIEYQDLDGKINGAIIGIPYSFGFDEDPLKGIYLIPICSEEGVLKKNIINKLLKELHKKILNDFDLMFLVTDSELLQDYYRTLGFHDSFYIIQEHYTPLHNFHTDFLLSIQDSDERIRNLKNALFNDIEVFQKEDFERNNNDSIGQLIDFIRDIERKKSTEISLIHEAKDLEYLFQEDSMRNLDYFVSLDADKKITGIAFIDIEEFKRIKVLTPFVTDSCSFYCLLNEIKRVYKEYSVTINSLESKCQIQAIIQQTYAASNPQGEDLDNTFATLETPVNLRNLMKPLGLVKLLKFDNILKYIARHRRDVDFKLYIPDDPTPLNFDNKDHVYIIKNGTCDIDSIENHKQDKSLLKLSVKVISELLLRRGDASNLIMEAFGIPRLNLMINLLPYN